MAHGDPGTFGGTDLGLQPGEQLHMYGATPDMNKWQAQAQVEHEKNLIFQRGRPVQPDYPVTQARVEIPLDYRKAGVPPPQELSRFVRYSLGFLVVAIVIFAILDALPSSLFRKTIFPFFAAKSLEVRVAALGGFSTAAEWPALRTNKAPEAVWWAAFTESPERRVQLHIYRNREAQDNVARVERWLSRECTRGTVPACTDRAIAMQVGYLPRFDKAPGFLLPQAGKVAESPQVLALQERLATTCWTCDAWTEVAVQLQSSIRDLRRPD